MEVEDWRSSHAALAAAVHAAEGGEWSFECAYMDEAAPAALRGFRALHRRSGLVLDALWMPVVPQCLMWANTPLASDCGALAAHSTAPGEPSPPPPEVPSGALGRRSGRARQAPPRALRLVRRSTGLRLQACAAPASLQQGAYACKHPSKGTDYKRAPKQHPAPACREQARPTPASTCCWGRATAGGRWRRWRR